MTSSDDITLSVVKGAGLQSALAEIRPFLAARDLQTDENIDTFVLAHTTADHRLAGCAGLDQNVIKCVCTSEEFRDAGLSLKLATEVIKCGLTAGYDDLFLYTKYSNIRLFRGWGFSTLVEIPGAVAFLHYDQAAFEHYIEALRAFRKEGALTGSIVLNANPFTNGHRYLVEQASKDCDIVHIFLVKEDVSLFSYQDRLTLVRKGVADLKNVIVHEGSDYIISHATFPGYFLKDRAAVNEQASAVDALMFRRYIAPALNVSVRYVGTEPLDKTTAMYNVVLRKFLSTYPCDSKPVELKELERKTCGPAVISASRVRELIKAGNFEAIKELVPPSTFEFIRRTHTQS
ncbi:[citrate (pro-3S)-lyase] ligase [Acetobacter thailandicus]|uniref:[citrate (pro-3S)-lyase] ligase n=1 Tax=Acetobacter thailandicus TaxID=1502842 RepID=UPI001BA5BC4F|nr:[citrate (pro-3S)-lyase] ligase [Acetobacter thailandicus]MBS0985103.1 [citrate (pro-3S)-lyase] ligase [Acetobacter thailandicus]